MQSYLLVVIILLLAFGLFSRGDSLSGIEVQRTFNAIKVAHKHYLRTGSYEGLKNLRHGKADKGRYTGKVREDGSFVFVKHGFWSIRTCNAVADNIRLSYPHSIPKRPVCRASSRNQYGLTVWLLPPKPDDLLFDLEAPK